MSKVVIKAEHLSKDYGLNRGVFDLNFEIKEGEMIGFVGSNGAGKTTTIRQIMGFIKPTSGSITVNGLDCYEHASEIAKSIGYVPGEIAFPDLGSGISFFKMQAELYGITNFDRTNELISTLALDPKASLKRMSKGMKQKTALVAALMNNPDIIILDEPTTGLDPLMRDSFLNIIKEEHKKGKTILMSTHLYEEVEETCDRVALIDNGRIIDIVEVNMIANPKIQVFDVSFKNPTDIEKIPQKFPFERINENLIEFKVNRDRIGSFLKVLQDFELNYISEKHDTLQNYFNRKFKEGKHEIL